MLKTPSISRHILTWQIDSHHKGRCFDKLTGSSRRTLTFLEPPTLLWNQVSFRVKYSHWLSAPNKEAQRLTHQIIDIDVQ